MDRHFYMGVVVGENSSNREGFDGHSHAFLSLHHIGVFSSTHVFSSLPLFGVFPPKSIKTFIDFISPQFLLEAGSF
ncbi:MAG: hypothetical protein JJU28_13955 [Cyclobacteriaceae bacterium]|nr:hypothetical protein [Cyclobacteriaceae bacterium]